MKKLFTLVLGLATLVAVNAQSTQQKITLSGAPVSKPSKVKPHVTQLGNTDSRAQVVPMILDYDGVDDNYAAQTSGGTMTRYAWQVNNNLPADSAYTFKYAVVVFDTLIYADSQTGDVVTFPKSQASFTLDSLAIPYIHRNASGQNDTIRISVLNRTGLVIPQALTTGNVTGTSLWDTVIVTNTSLNDDQAFSKEFMMYPGLSFAAGNTFAVRFDFAGPISDEMLILVSYRDDCAAECVAAPAAAGENTVVKANIQGSSMIFTGEGVITDCDDDNVVDACEYFYFQNAVFFPFITANVNYGATVSADLPAACPNEVVTLTANGFGSDATPYTYSWSASSGQLTSSSDQQVSLVLGNSNSVVTVTVTDANNVSTTATYSVLSRGINVQFTNNQPVTLTCGGGSATLITSISGFTQGRNYTWSTGATGTNTVSQQVTTPGTYRVTVTNSSNCSATASIDVAYASGASNTVSFAAPTDVNLQQPGVQVCINTPVTFTNTSSNQNGWTALWTYGDSNIGTSLDGSNIYTAVSQYQVTLSMDSAGCTFNSAPLTINVLSASSGPCVTGINDVEFSNEVSLMPNPTTGNLTVSVSGVEKALSIKVYNILGSEVYNFNTAEVASSMNKQIDLSNLNSGTYLVKVQTGNKIAIKRVTVSK